MAITLPDQLELSEAWHRNLSVPRLVEAALAGGEGRLTADGALVAVTGAYTGRSPQDRFIVSADEVEGDIAWGEVNRPFAPDDFDDLYARVVAYLRGREAYVFDGSAGADPAHRLPVRVVTEYAWHNLFARQLFLGPAGRNGDDVAPPLTILAAPGFRADPKTDGTRSGAFVLLHLARRLVLIGGTAYAGEIKKAVFGTLNYLLPGRGALPMHCSANVSADGDVALFFGLSGTGKTTLSADPDRSLIGDDEHGWSEHGVFNFEGGCYAKCIHLSPEREPQIHAAIRFGSVLENVVVDPVSRRPDYDDDALTENTRAAYPVEYIPNARIPGVGGHPRAIVFLTADAFGVMPPVARLDRSQSMYHFLSGYTSKLAGTERGVTDPQATFSTCFAEPFLPLSPIRYARILGERIARHGTRVYLINTGWTGGPYGVGHRIDLRHTRAMVAAVLDGRIEDAQFRTDPVFGFQVPRTCPDVPSAVLDPRRTWPDPADYDTRVRELARRFAENFKRFEGEAPPEVRRAGPRTA